jgi:hypothetical protein
MDSTKVRELEWVKYFKNVNLKDLRFQVAGLNNCLKYLKESRLTLDGFIKALYTDYLNVQRSTDVYGQGANRMVKAEQKISLVRKADPGLKLNPNDKYIDIGSGDGSMGLTLIQQYKLNNYLFTDVQDHLAPEVKAFILESGEPINDRFMIMDSKGPSTYKANVISIFQVLHHSGDIDHILKRLNIPVGGKLLLSEHDVSSFTLRYLVLLEHITYEISEIPSGSKEAAFRQWFLNYDLDLTSFEALNKKLHTLNYVLVGRTPPSKKNATYYSVYRKVEGPKPKGGKADRLGKDPLILKSLDLVYNHVKEQIISHVFGFTTLNLTRDLVTSFFKRHTKKYSIHFVCNKTTEKSLAAYSSIAKSGRGDDATYDPLIGVFAGDHEKVDYDINKMIFCTTRKMIGLLLKFKAAGTLLHVASVFINSWDEYDVNAYALLGLLTQVLRDEIPKCYIILTSVSRWISPSIELELQPLSVESNKIEIEYPTDHTPIEMVIASEGGTIAYLGNLNYNLDENNVVLATHPIRSRDATLVIDSMLNQYGGKITKQLADLRADSIQEGYVNRYISYARYLNLRDLMLPKEKVGLDTLIIFLLTKGFKPKVITKLFMESHEMVVDKFLEEFSRHNLSYPELNLMKVTGLSVNSTVFLNKWISSRPDQKLKQKNRSMYVGGLIACLINQHPQIYTVDGNMKGFEKFRARNDLETMCNMWLDLQSSLSIPFVFWKNPEYLTSSWANLDIDSKFDEGAILELFNLVKATVIYMLKDTKDGKEGTRPDYGYGVFIRIQEAEINDAVDIIKVMFPPREIRWDFSNTLPSSLRDKRIVYPIQSKEDMLYMYVNDTRLHPLNLQPENLDAFMLLE